MGIVFSFSISYTLLAGSFQSQILREEYFFIMITYPCISVLRNLKKLTNNSAVNISYLYDSTCFCLDDSERIYDYHKYQHEIESIISYLIEQGYLQYNYDNTYNFCLTQKGLHRKFLTVQSATIFLLKNLLLPILVSIVTTLITLRIKGQL